jgi:hypothetical protein
MSIQTIRTYNIPTWFSTVTLEGTAFILTARYNQRDLCWYLSLADGSAVDILNGVKIVCNRFLLQKSVDPRRPAGDFFCCDPTGNLTPPGLNDLLPGSSRCTLYYVTSDLVTAIEEDDVPTFAAFLQSLQTNTSTGTASTYGSQ